MAKVEWIFTDEIDAIMDDIPDSYWYKKSQPISQKETDDDHSQVLELLSSW